VAHTCNPSYSEAEISRIEVQSQPRQIVPRDPVSKKKKVAQDVGPEFKPQYCKNKINKIKKHIKKQININRRKNK
jgi:hypothetical protein